MNNNTIATSSYFLSNFIYFLSISYYFIQTTYAHTKTHTHTHTAQHKFKPDSEYCVLFNRVKSFPLDIKKRQV